MHGSFRLELSHPPHALIRLSLCFFLARSLVILASTILDRKNVDLSGWQLVQCRRAVILEDIPMASEWAFLLSQESARTRVLRLTEDTYKPGSHFAQCFFTLNRSNVCTHHMVLKAVLSLSLLQGLVGAC